MPDSDPRTDLVDALRRTLTLGQLQGVFRTILGETLEDHVALPAPYTSVVDDLVEYLEQQDKQMSGFLARLSVLPLCRPELRRAIHAYLGLPSTEANPYRTLVPNGLPFVNRTTFRDSLAEFFTTPHATLLLVEGPPKHGRTFSAELLYHVGPAEGVELVRIDLSVHRDILAVYDLIIYDLGIPPFPGRDEKAQAPALARGLAVGLRKKSRELTPGERYCLVFDQYDDPAVDATFRQFVDTLATELVSLRADGISVVVIGNAEGLVADIKKRGIRDEVRPLIRPDVERYVEQWLEENGQPHTDEAVAQECDKILEGLASPLSPTCLKTMNDRLRNLVLDV